MTLFRQAADQNNSNAFGNIGFMYANGEGVPQDYAQAVSWYRHGATRGEPNAQASLGYYLYEGRQGVPQNRTEGLMWLRRAAAGGYEWALSYMAQNNIPLQPSSTTSP